MELSSVKNVLKSVTVEQLQMCDYKVGLNQNFMIELSIFEP